MNDSGGKAWCADYCKSVRPGEDEVAPGSLLAYRALLKVLATITSATHLRSASTSGAVLARNTPGDSILGALRLSTL